MTDCWISSVATATDRLTINHSAPGVQRALFGEEGTVWCPLDSLRAAAHTRGPMRSSHLTLPERSAYQRLEDVVGCKWSTAVVSAVQRGIVRPGQLERYIPGISTKVLNERLRKLVHYGLLVREDHRAETGLHVEYRLTVTGQRLAGVIEQIHGLQAEHDATRATAPAPASPNQRSTS